MKKRIVAIGLIAILIVSTLAGCSCTNNGTSQNSNNTQVTAYKCDFKNSDIAIPKGTKLTDNGLEVTDKADATVKNVLDIEKQLPAIIARDGEEQSPELKYMKEYNEKQLRWKNYNAVADYTADTAKQIDPTFGKVTEFGKDVFDVVRAYYTGDVGAAISGVSGVLNMFGIFGGGGGVTNEQILMEVQKVYSAVQDVALDVKDLQGLTTAMSMELDETTMQAYRNGLQTFDNAMIALDTDAEIIQQMYVQAAVELQQQGVNAPAKDATPEQQQDYIGKLNAYISEQQNSNPNFKNFEGLMSDLTNNYTLVSGELAKTKDFSPLTAYDNYWNMYFNWESQGYSLREAYRGNAMFQVKRGYAIIAMYYNIGAGNTVNIYQKYGQMLRDSLDAIEQNGPGVSPQVVADNWVENSQDQISYNLNLENGLYSGTFNKRMYALYYSSGLHFGEETKNGVNVSTGLVEKYVSKLHGRSLNDDLLLAGINGYERYTDGLVFNIVKKSKTKVKADLITWDGKLYKDATITQKFDEDEIEQSGLSRNFWVEGDSQSIEEGCFELR